MTTAFLMVEGIPGYKYPDTHFPLGSFPVHWIQGHLLIVAEELILDHFLGFFDP